ncbi:DUF3343 domain-containing protein [Slackia piriformis]|uniref:DUF3343 domain-containing protein n=1 Tax=Slackia piriformis TaxID=626934 RepID=UPI0026DD83AB|nr:DUF3343 domain-containing protein [Slackia piriformis]MDO5023237.1 DUF3343 domain-containing protein [Slackia piriformis]
MADTHPAHYVLVRSHTEGFQLHGALRKAGFNVHIAPAPHGVQARCGMSILVKTDESKVVRAFIEEQRLPIEGMIEIENAINPKRDTYC